RDRAGRSGRKAAPRSPRPVSVATSLPPWLMGGAAESTRPPATARSPSGGHRVRRRRRSARPTAEPAGRVAAPRRQFVAAFTGTAELTASDGEARRFGPGARFSVEDLTGEGHRTRAVGNEAVV